MRCSWTFLGITVLIHYLFALAGSSNETDHLALLEFKGQISADPFGVLSSWNASTHFCNWFGVTCSRRHHQRVTLIELPDSKLSGSISPHVANLSFLLGLHLQNNSFTHQIPPEFGKLRRLQQLILPNNSLQGTIPPNISACSNLIWIDVDYNDLVGEIPIEFGSLSKLISLSFGANGLTGNVPSSLGNLSSLDLIFASHNHLVGSIPNELDRLRSLTRISMGDNMLSGTIPHSIFNLSSLVTFDLGANQIQGTLPSNFGDNLPNLQFFSIGTNQFTGSIPVSVSNASGLAILQLNQNKLSGKVPSLEKLSLLYGFRLSINNLGTAGAEEDLTFLCSLANASTLQVLAVNGNKVGGGLPECIGNLSSSLTMLLLSNNKIYGSIPNSIGSLVNLERLHLFKNQLSGDIPNEIGLLQKMQDMSLGENNLSGKIPSSLGNLKLLSQLSLYKNNLEGSIPSNLSQCQKLVLLSLFSNNLTGDIPPDVVSISSLSIALYLDGNRLSGAIPVEIANLKNLGYLDLSNNLLSGEIPNAIGSCVKLENLRLGGNFLHGEIPSSLSSLGGIVELNFSYNNLSGQIPKFLERFSSLQSLDFSHNNFEGAVPVEGAFKNSSTTFVKGNNELCGGIPEFKLPKCKSKKRKSVIVPILAITFVAVMILLSVVLVYCLRKKRTIPATTPSTKSLAKVSYQDLLQATDNFSSENMIGKGGFGSVYKGVLQQIETIVAVKVINLLHPGALKSFVAECEVLKNIRHRNLVKVITACSGIDHSGNDFKALVYEFMANGSLDEWLHQVPGGKTNINEEPRKLSFSFLERMDIAIDVASALDYLHHGHQESPIVHCDLKPSNVLLDAEMIGHIGDFGLARFLQDVRDMEMSSIAIKGSIGYTAPEYGMGSGLSTEGDVYSYGILLLEVFTGKRPTDDMFQDSLNLHSIVKEALPDRVMEISDCVLFEDVEEVRRPIIVECLVLIFGVGVACCAEAPRERPSISYALRQLGFQRDKFLAG